jgi:hypothetical protein
MTIAAWNQLCSNARTNAGFERYPGSGPAPHSQFLAARHRKSDASSLISGENPA